MFNSPIFLLLVIEVIAIMISYNYREIKLLECRKKQKVLVSYEK